MTDLPLPRSEREQTDESLRLERDRADRALDDDVSEADETADAVISQARARADALVAAARATTDRTAIDDQRGLGKRNLGEGRDRTGTATGRL